MGTGPWGWEGKGVGGGRGVASGRDGEDGWTGLLQACHGRLSPFSLTQC